MYRRILEAELGLALNAITLDTELYVRNSQFQDDDEEIVDAMDDMPHGGDDDRITNRENYYRRRQLINQFIEDINHQIDTMSHLGARDIDPRLEELLVNGIKYVFQEQTSDDVDGMLNEFGAAINSLGLRVKPHFPQISGTLNSGLYNKSAKVRQQAADLISIIAVVMKQCEEEQLMGHLGAVLYESLGEEDPEVLGSVLGALKAIISVIDLTKMSFSLDYLLSRLIPILENRHEKVEENCIELVGCIATRGAENVSAVDDNLSHAS